MEQRDKRISEIKNMMYDNVEKIKEYEHGITELEVTLKSFKQKKSELANYSDSLLKELSSYDVSTEEYDNIKLECNCGKIEHGRHHMSCPSFKNK